VETSADRQVGSVDHDVQCQSIHHQCLLNNTTNDSSPYLKKNILSTQLRVYIQLNTKQVISETFFLAKLLAWYWRN